MESLFEFIQLIRGKPWKYRLKVKNQPLLDSWNRFLISPTTSYIESDGGPYSIHNLEWIDINPVEIRYIGKLVAPKTIDHTNELVELLSKQGLDFKATENFIRLFVR